MDRRAFIKGAAAGAAALALQGSSSGADGPSGRLRAEIAKRHDEAVKRLQRWIQKPTIAAEGRGIEEGCALAMELLREAGLARVERIPTDGHPGVFATLDAGAPRTVGVYLMYDVKQADPAEWSSPPWDAALASKPGLGEVVIGRGAANQKGPQSAFLAALHAIRGAGLALPVNLVVIAEGEEEIGSPHLSQITGHPEVMAALSKCMGVFIPSAVQGAGGEATIYLGAKGMLETELACRGGPGGRGPAADIHSSAAAMVESPSWRLVHALATLVSPDGEPRIAGFADGARPLDAAEKAMIAEAAGRMDEAAAMRQMGVSRWIGGADWPSALERLAASPTVNIEGLTAGHTGPGGKSIVPHEAVAKLDLRLVPDMTAEGALAALKAHLASHGFGDIEVRVTGSYDPTSTPADSALLRAQAITYRRAGLDPIVWPRSGGSSPFHVFTGAPLHLAAGHFGLGYGAGAHAPDEHYLIESSIAAVRGLDGAAQSFAEHLYDLAAIG